MAGIIQTLLRYKELTSNKNNHRHLIQDKTVILYVATLLEHKNRVELNLCLDIIENIMENEATHTTLTSIFGLFEAIESLSIRTKHSDFEIHERCSQILDSLRKSAPPAYSTRLRSKKDQSKIKKLTSLFVIVIEDLTKSNRKNLEKVLLSIGGVISFIINLEEKRCTLRVNSRLSIKIIVKKIWLHCNLKALVISKKKGEQSEVFIDVLNDIDATPPPEYFPDEESFSTNNPLTFPFKPKDPTSWFKSITDKFNNAFYW